MSLPSGLRPTPSDSDRTGATPLDSIASHSSHASSCSSDDDAGTEAFLEQSGGCASDGGRHDARVASALLSASATAHAAESFLRDAAIAERAADSLAVAVADARTHRRNLRKQLVFLREHLSACLDDHAAATVGSEDTAALQEIIWRALDVRGSIQLRKQAAAVALSALQR